MSRAFTEKGTSSEWDEDMIRQLVHTVKVISAAHIVPPKSIQAGCVTGFVKINGVFLNICFSFRQNIRKTFSRNTGYGLISAALHEYWNTQAM